MGFFNKRPILKKEDIRLTIVKIMGIVLLILLLTVLITPSVIFASWWNPLSWKIFQKTDIKTQILEKRILELENKLNIATTTNSASTIEVNATTTSTINIDEKKVIEEIEPNTSAPAASETNTSSFYDKYRDPITGKIMTPTEWVDYYDKKCASQDKVRSTTMNSDGTISCITYTQACQAKFGINSYSTGKNSDGTNECNCATGYAVDSNNKCIVIDYNALCQKKYGINSYSTGKNSSGTDTCGCKTGYYFNQSGTSCQLIQVNDYNNAPYRQDGNAYSPEQLNAMDCAWYGINCPTINVRILN
jgi:hypothetical protein